MDLFSLFNRSTLIFVKEHKYLNKFVKVEMRFSRVHFSFNVLFLPSNGMCNTNSLDVFLIHISPVFVTNKLLMHMPAISLPFVK